MRDYPVHRQEKWRNEKESISQEKEWISILTFLLYFSLESLVSKEYRLEIEEIYSYRMAVVWAACLLMDDRYKKNFI